MPKSVRIMPLFKVAHRPVARRRAACGWSQAELARRADIARASVSAIERGRLSPSVATALALARAFKCSVEELFGGGVEAWTPTGPK
jgi:putative transcriptional regulator